MSAPTTDMVPARPSTDNEAVRLRSYQLEMLDKSLQKNVIVAMDTGSGKTHIAIARIAAELQRSPPDRLIFFVAPSVALVDQQARQLSAHLPAYHVLKLTGEDGVDKWTQQAVWDTVLTDVRVVVCTPAILLDGLTHGFIKLDRLSLCVFDEAHRATKKHPMNSILQMFYHPAKQQQRPVPHILGLTASPVVNSKAGSLETIEHNLDSIAVTPKHTREELETYVNRPELISIPYSEHKPAAEPVDPILNSLAQATKSYDLSQDPYILDLQATGDARSQKEYAKVMMSRETYCSKQLRALDIRAMSVKDELGESGARWYVRTCISTFRRSLSTNTLMMPDLSEKEKQHLGRIFCSIDEQAMLREHTCELTQLSITDKVSKLVEVLTNTTVASRAIIFVEQRVHTAVLAQILRQIPEITRTYKIGSFVGTSTSSKRKVSVADLVELKDQEKDLDAFRSGEKNLMIATTVLEEGIDVSACNMVLCFNLPKNLVSFVQRRGRARQKDSKYFLFVPEDGKENDQQWAALEAQIKKEYMDDTRKLADSLDDELALSEEAYHIKSTGAVLTLENAKAHLYHFCSTGIQQVSNYVDLRPEFDTQQDPGCKLWSASVDLPAFVFPDLRHAKSAKPRRSESVAIKDAAFQSYAALHREGLINDNLLPLRQDYGPETGETHLDQPSIVQVADRAPWKELWNGQSDLWYTHSVKIASQNELVLEAVMYVPFPQVPDSELRMFWNKHKTYTLEISRTSITPLHLNPSRLQLLRQTTDLVLRTVHGNRMLKDDDFIALLAPANVEDLGSWSDSLKGIKLATPGMFTERDHAAGIGVVRIKGQQNGRPFFFHSTQELPTEDSEAKLELVVTAFPKRRDFLHRLAGDAIGAAHTAKQALSIDECTVDNLPAAYALFAAFVPCLMHRMELSLLVDSLNRNSLATVDIKDQSLILNALSSPATNEEVDYNQLEYLGDSILKHCTELQVISQHPTWPEGCLTAERDRIVRNSNLAKAALRAGLDKYILNKPFTGNKWKPIYIGEALAAETKEREMSTKTLADVVEALIGASFVDGGLAKALLCIKTLLPTEQWDLPEHCFDNLQKELRSTYYTHLENLERLIGHKFQHPTLLLEAITHVSFPYNRTGLSYERLEFLGDSVLDLIVTPQLYAHSRNLRHWELHSIHEALVNSHFLGFCCLNYAIEEKFDIDANQQITRSTRKIHLHDFLRAGGQLTPLRLKSIKAYESLHKAIEDALTHWKEYPWTDLVTLSPQKFFCDLVESILGALFVDSRGNLEICQAFIENLGVLKHMHRILNDRVETLSPKERLGVVADRDKIQYVNSREETEDGIKMFACTVRVGDADVVAVAGCGNKDEAEVKAAHQACKALEEKGALAGRFGARNLKRKFVASATTKDTGGDAMEVDETGSDVN